MRWLLLVTAPAFSVIVLATAQHLPLFHGLNASFVYDGTSHSDVAQQLYHRGLQGDAVARLSTRVALPLPVTARLQRLQLPASAFPQLPGLLQRALLWDAGFVLFESRVLVQVWTANGRSMADVLVTTREWEAASTGLPTCTTRECTQPNTTNATSHRAFDCACDTHIATVAKCAVADTYAVFDDAVPVGAPTAVWGTGADPNAVPDPVLVEHNCRASIPDANTDTASESESENSNGGIRDRDMDASNEDRTIRSTSLASVYSIYTAPTVSTRGQECSPTQFASFVVPCARIAMMSSSMRAKWTEPKPSAWLDEWLVQVAQTSDGSVSGGVSVHSPSPPLTSSSSSSSSAASFKLVLLIPILLGSLVVVAGVGLVLLRRTSTRREDALRAPTAGSSLDAGAFLTPVHKNYCR